MQKFFVIIIDSNYVPTWTKPQAGVIFKFYGIKLIQNKFPRHDEITNKSKRTTKYYF